MTDHASAVTGKPAVAPTTVAGYLLERLSSLGVRHVFGVPGDYDLAMLDVVLEHRSIKWVGNVTELGAAYAADGYARLAGFGALITTFGVGELSAINGVAGSYAEYVPLVHVAVGPSEAMERAGALVHHTAGDGNYGRFARAHEQVTCAHAVLRADNAAAEIDRVLSAAIRERRPVYLRLPSDVAAAPAPPPIGPLTAADEDGVDEASLEAFLAAAAARLAGASSVAVLADFLVDRFGARNELAALLAAGRFPHATLSMGKTVVDEGNPDFAGVYAGAFSDPATRTVIDQADVLIRAGVVLTDTTTGGFSYGFDPQSGIDVAPVSAAVDGQVFKNVPLAAALSGLTRLVTERGITSAAVQATPAAVAAVPSRPGAASGPLTQKYLWDAVAAALQPASTVVAEQGTSFFGICMRRFPSGARFIGQPLWASIGYSLPALLGAQFADPHRRGVLLIGDGSAQMTIQELGTIARHRLTPVIILVNNEGYTIERAIHGPRAVYNDIAAWNWAAVPAALGADALVLTARTAAELDAALAKAAQAPDRLVFIEAVTAMDDFPELLARIAEDARDRNQGRPAA
jgi:indolepyruvate decarboxylase